MSEIFLGVFSCHDAESAGFCSVQCSLCKLQAIREGGDIDPRTDKQKLQAIRKSKQPIERD